MRFWYRVNLFLAVTLALSIKSSYRRIASLFLLSLWFSTLKLVSSTSVGIIVSLPYASRNDVSLIGIFAVVLYAHKTLGNSSDHIPFVPSSQVLMILSKDRFVTSICPLA